MSYIATTIEQSKHLLSLGLDAKTADMCFEMEKGNWTLNVGKKSAQVNRGFAIPAWSLYALLEVMPKEHEPEIQKSPVTGQYFVYGFFDMDKPTYMTKDYDSPVDAAYEMVCWMLEQGFIKKGGEQ